MNRTLLLLPTLLGACTASLHDDTFATGSQTVIANADHDALYVVDADGGAVVRFDPATGAKSSLTVGTNPSRLARAGDQIFVSLAGDRSLAILSDEGGKLSEVATIEVGAEPRGLVAREDGTKVYVALAMEDAVAEVDVETRAVTRTWSVGGHPTWVALHPSGNALYVASAVGGDLSWIDLHEGGEVTALDLPSVYGAGQDNTQRFTRRMTGDLAVSPDGKNLAAPALYLDNLSPVSEPDEVEQPSDGYGSVGLGVSKINPSMLVVPLDGQGRPNADNGASVLVAGDVQSDDDFGASDTGSTFGGTQVAVRSYLTSATFSPDGASIYASMEASGAVVVLSSSPVYPGEANCRFCSESFDTGGGGLTADQAGFASSPLVLVGTDDGPRGVAFLGDEAYVHSFLDRSVGALGASAVQDDLAQQYGSGSAFGMTFHAQPATEVAENVLSADVAAGRRLFYSATASQMAASGAGISCSTCHYDSRNDGLTWTFTDGVRQTPSLAGAVGSTGPFTWTDQVESVSDEAEITSSGRMGGDGLSYAEAAQVAAYIETIPAVDLPNKGATDAAVLRGKAIFERADVACSTCHTGERYTDNLSWPMFGLEAVNTPSLTGVAATAPYFHDGSAASLADVLVVSKSGEMGDTSMLSADELSDLEAYLRSL